MDKPQAFVNQFDNLDIYRHVSMPTLVEQWGESLNGNRKIKDPRHEDKNPSGHVYDDHIYFYCCGDSWDPIAYTAYKLTGNPKVTGQDFWNVVDRIADDFGLPRPQRDPVSQARYEAVISYSEIYEQVWAKARKNPKFGIDYLIGRGISKELSEEHAGYLPRDYEPPHREQSQKAGLYSSNGNFLFRDRCVIGIRYQGKIVDIYGRALNPDHKPSHIYCGKTDPTMPQTLWGMDTIKDPSHIYITESIIDCLSMWTHGITNAVAVFGTQGLTDERIELLKRRGVQKVTIAFDTDGNNE